MRSIANLACVADVLKPRLVTSAKQCRDPCSGAPNGLNELPEVSLEFRFILIGKLTIAFLTDQSWCLLKSCYTGWGSEQGFRRCFAAGLNKSFVSSVAQAISK